MTVESVRFPVSLAPIPPEHPGFRHLYTRLPRTAGRSVEKPDTSSPGYTRCHRQQSSTMDDEKVTLYYCTECGTVESHELDTHIMRSHRPGGVYRPMESGDELVIEEVQQRLEIPVSELREYAIE